MPYFHDTSKEIHKLAAYAAKSFHLLGGFTADTLTRDSAPVPCWGTAADPEHIPQCLLLPPQNLWCLDKALNGIIHKEHPHGRRTGRSKVDNDGDWEEVFKLQVDVRF